MGVEVLELDYYDPMPRLKHFHTLTSFTLVTLLTMGWSAVAAPAAPKAPPDAGLTADTFYELLVGEISARDDASNMNGVNLLLNAARKVRAESVYERAFEAALRTRSTTKVLEVANAWVQAFPHSQDANRYQLQVLLGMNRVAETQQALKRQFTATPAAERKRFIQQIPSYFGRINDKKQAANVVEKAFQAELANRNTPPTIAANIWVTIGVLRMVAGDAESALDACRKAVALDAGSKDPIPLAIYLVTQKVAAAESLVQQYLNQNKDYDVELHQTYVTTLWKIERIPAAYEQTLALLQKVPEYTEGWLLRGALEVEQSQFDKAEPSLKTYIQLAQSALNNAKDSAKAAAKGKEKDKDKEDEPEDKAKKERQGIVEAYAFLAKVAKHKEQPELVKKYIEQARELAADNTNMLYELAMSAEKAGELDLMESLLRQIIRMDSGYHNAYNALGYSLADRNIRLSEAYDLIKEALNLKPNDPYIMDSMGWVEFRAGNTDEALRLLQAAFEAGQDAEIAAHWGEVLWTKGQPEKARTIWEQGFKINPKNETLRETMKRFQQKP